MIPGSNILKTALTVIARQAINYYEFTGRVLNNVGQDVATYAAPTTIYGSFQPVPRRLYEAYGLDFQKTYYTFYTLADTMDVRRDVSGDQISFQGKRYQCESSNDWFALDGWVGILVVLIDSPALTQFNFGFNAIPEINNNYNFLNGAFYAG